MKRKLLVGTFLLGAVYSLSACAIPVTYSAEPIEAWVVDADTGHQIEGAVVVAHWVLEGGIHVDRVGDLVVLETVTDKDGRFRFSAWGPIEHRERSRLTNMDPEILIFKSGYGYRRLVNPSTKEAIEGKPYPVRTSQWNNKRIQLRSLGGTASEQSKALLDFSKNIESFTVRQPQPCNWLKVPQSLSVMMRERIRLERVGAMPKWDRTVDKQLLDGEKHLVEVCGQPAMSAIQKLADK